MRMTAKLLKITAIILFVVSQVLLFFDLDSKRHATTRPFGAAAMVCIAATIIIWLIALRRTARERQQRET